MVRQDNITHDRTCLGRMEGGDRICIYTYTYDINYLILLLCDI